MEPYAVEFYLYCDWKELTPTYRIYFDDELMTERTYIWDNERQVLEERVSVIADSTTPHTLTIETVGLRDGTFSVERLVTDPPGLPVNIKIA
jgi:hypothetical protein